MLNLSDLDIVWLLVCSCLLLVMQAGFVCLESGLVRTKNSINVVMKNLLDLSTAFLVFGVVGFSLMFYGPAGWLTYNPIFFDLSPSFNIIFLFQAMFCATAITIVSGAVSERMTYFSYFILAIFLAGILYPLVGHWIWAGTIGETHQGWLNALGFVDFAGGTVVHSMGGWVALAAILKIGPRIGRYTDKGDNIVHSSITMTCLGSLMIWLGWLGFNGGSLLKFDANVSSILLITLFSGSGGLFAGLMTGYVWYQKPLVMPVINGGLIGLVAITAGANVIPLAHAIPIGFIAGFLPGPINYLLNKAKLDDVVGAVPVHLAGGVFGTIIVGFYTELADGESRFSQLVIQTLGIVVVGLTVFLSTYIFLSIVNKFIAIRVSPEEEIMGLNVTEHNENAANADLVSQMKENISAGELLTKIQVDPQSDAYEASLYYNNMISVFENMNAQNQKALDSAVYHATHDSLTGMSNRYAINKKLDEEFEQTKRHQRPLSVAIIDIDYFKSINDVFGHDVGDKALKHFAELLRNSIRITDNVGRIGGEEFCVLFNNSDILEAKKVLEKLKTYVALTPFNHGDKTTTMSFSAGIAALSHCKSVAQCLKLADTALYEAKANGRKQIVISTLSS